jgi:hypothetical protein
LYEGAGGFRFGEPGFEFGRRVKSASQQLSDPKTPHEKEVFHELPDPTGDPPYRLDLAKVLGKDAVAAIAKAGRLVFHAVGDTGGIDYAFPQRIVAHWMEKDAAQSFPAFFYHLGDVVYYDGEHGSYYAQFYEPYLHYPGPIFAIPGNHDTDVGVPPNHTSLEPFMANFCTPKPEHSVDARDVERTTMIQPNCYWTLETPLATIVGLATNAPEHGVVKADQRAWLVGELKDAPKSRALLVALHHPPLSVDAHHGASKEMRDLLDGAFAEASRWPDLILSGHIHTYERFTRPLPDGKELAYVVAGAGGYPNLHTLANVGDGPPPVPWTDPVTGWTLENYSQEHRHGFLRLSVTKTSIRGTYTTVPRPQESWTNGPVKHIDTFTIPIRKAGH